MSFILDALRKSENARLRQEHPAMFDARPLAVRRRFPAWSLGLGLLLGLNLLALAYALLRDGPAAAQRSVAPAMTTAVGAAPEASPTAASIAAPVATTRTPALPSAATLPMIADGAAPSPPAPLRSSPAAPTRTRDDLLATGDAVPEAQLSLHVYDADPARRFVFLNGQRLREGDIAANGLRVLRIDADGVVLDHRGSDFKVGLEP